MFSDDFLLGNSLHTQKKYFQQFLCHGLIDELQNHFPFSTSFSNYSLELVIDAPNYVLKKPKLSSHQAFDEGEHYKIALYVPGTWLINNVPMGPTKFLFLGEIPMMTEEGHFIFNGSARNIVGQLARSPGMYYKVRLGKGNFRRHLVSFLSENGCWFRIWMDRWGRCWGRINKLEKIPLFALIRAFGFHDLFLSRMLTNELLFQHSRNKFPTDKLWFEETLYNAIIFIYMDLNGKQARPPYYLRSCEFFFRTFFQPKTYSFGYAGRRFLDRKLGRPQQLTQTFKPEDFLDALEKLMQLEYGFIWVDNIDHLQNRRVRTVHELFKKELRTGLQEIERTFQKKIDKIQDFVAYPNYNAPLLENIRHPLENSKAVKPFVDHKFFSKPLCHQFSKKAQTIRYGFSTEGNRFVGPKVVTDSFRYQRKKIDKFLQQSFVEPRYLAPRYKHFFGLLMPSQQKFKKYFPLNTLKREFIAQRTLFLKKRLLSQFVFSKQTELTQKSFHDINLKAKKVYHLPYAPKWCYRPIVYSQFSLVGLQPLFLSNPPSRFLQSLLDSQILTKAFNQFFGLHPLSQLLDQSNPLSSAAHRRRFTSLGPGGVNRDAGLAVRDIHPSHYGRLCPIETPEGKNAGLVHSLALYGRVNSFGTLETPFFYQYLNSNFINSSHSSYQNEQSFIQQQLLKKTSFTNFVRAPFQSGNSEPYFSKKTLFQEKLKKSIFTDSLYTCESKTFFENSQLNAPAQLLETCRFLDSEEEFFFTKGQPIFFEHVAPQSFYSKKFPSKSFEKQLTYPKTLISEEQVNSLPIETVGSEDHVFQPIEQDRCQFRAISPVQILSLATSLIPFLEHNDANRALMGSNMQRQAVPLLYREKAIVGTGFEKSASQGVVAKKSGIVYTSNSTQVVLRTEQSLDIYPLATFSRSNQATSLHEQSFVKQGEPILRGTAFADREATYGGELAIGRNLLLGYMPWEGYNFEDAVVISERLVQEDMYTSIHLERYIVPLDNRRNEQLTPWPPNVKDDEIENLDNDGIIQRGVFVDKEHILVGKKILIPNQNITPSFRLRAKILEEEAPFYDNTSYRLARGSGGKILRVQLKFNTRPQMAFPFRFWTRNRYYRVPWYEFSSKNNFNQNTTNKKVSPTFRISKTYQKLNVSQITRRRKLKPICSYTSPFLLASTYQKNLFPVQNFPLNVWIEKSKFDSFYTPATFLKLPYLQNKTITKSIRKELKNFKIHKRIINREALSTHVKSIQLLIATKRRIQIGDKISGRHGNKGIVSLILPRSHMPYLQDGTSLDMVLNPLGVPSRMNLGQIFESLLGLAGKHLRQSYKIVPFDEFHAAFLPESKKNRRKNQRNVETRKITNRIRLCASEISRTLVYQKLVQAQKKTGYKWLFDLNTPGKTYLFDGRSGEAFFQPVTVGVSYMLKLVHLVDDKIHARSTGPYALITQQPLRGKARDGGQRIGEMEVWALEGFGVACILQELLTIKSDDLEGRRTIFKSIVENTFQFELCSIQNGPLKWGRQIEFSQTNHNNKIIDLDVQSGGTFSTFENQSQHFEQTSTPFQTFKQKQANEWLWEVQPNDEGTDFISHGPRFSYKDYASGQIPAGKNIPESFQVLCSELQALCLDVFSLKI